MMATLQLAVQDLLNQALLSFRCNNKTLQLKKLNHQDPNFNSRILTRRKKPHRLVLFPRMCCHKEELGVWCPMLLEDRLLLAQISINRHPHNHHRNDLHHGHKKPTCQTISFRSLLRFYLEDVSLLVWPARRECLQVVVVVSLSTTFVWLTGMVWCVGSFCWVVVSVSWWFSLSPPASIAGAGSGEEYRRRGSSCGGTRSTKPISLPVTIAVAG